jgi:glycosyltransferase involved in cell wall biosynthesis
MSTTKFNVLYLDHTSKLGGGELALLSLTTHLSQYHYHPVVALASDGALVSLLRESSVETYVIPLDPGVVDTRKGNLGVGSFLKVAQIAKVFAYAIKLGKLAKRHNISIIHTNSLKSDIYGYIAGRTAGIPVIWHIRDHISDKYLPRIVATLFRLIAQKLPTAVIANSASTLSTLRLDKSKRAVVAYSGVDDELVRRIPVRDLNYVQPVVTMIGRIAEWKGQHIFIEAAAALRESYPQAKFQIVGSPLFGEEDYERRLRDQVEGQGLQNTVEFLGFRNDITDIIERSDIIVHASTIGEPFGQVVVQAMAACKPVIATNIGAIPEIITDGVNGIMVPPGDCTAVSDAILRILKDPKTAAAMGLAAREKVKQKFLLSDTMNTVTMLYDSLVAIATNDRYESTGVIA